MFTFIVEELEQGGTRAVTTKRMPIDPTAVLIDVVLAVIRSITKLPNSNRDNVSKVVYDGHIDIFECLDVPFKDCALSSSDKVILITINTSSSTAVVPTINAFTTMMRSSNTIGYLEVKVIKFPYLPDGAKEDVDIEEDLDDFFHSQTIQEQIKYLLRVICFRIGLGYRDTAERNVLIKFINSYSNVLCFVFKQHWKSLLRKDFPNLVKGHQKCMSLQLLTLGSSAKR